MVSIEMEAIDMGGNAPDRLAVLQGEKQLAFGMPEKGILERVEVETSLEIKRANPTGIVGVNSLGEIDEGGHVRLRLHRHHLDGAQAGHEASFFMASRFIGHGHSGGKD